MRGRVGSAGWLAGVAVLAAWAVSLVPPAGLAVPSAAAPAAAVPQPRRIVSLNLCTDQMLLDLVPRDRIAALSELVADPALSGRVEQAKGLPLLRGHAEEVLALAPDLVIAGEYSTPVTVDLLRRLGVRVVQIPMAFDFAGIRTAVRAVAAAAGVTAEGEAMVARFDRRLADAAVQAKSAQNSAPGAVVYHVNSLASGAGSLLDEIVRAAGFRNAARGMALGPAGRLPLESLVLDAPDVVVMATTADTYRTTVADNLRHPAFRALVESRRTVQLPMPLWMCGTPDVADAVAELAATRATPLARASVPPRNAEPVAQP